MLSDQLRNSLENLRNEQCEITQFCQLWRNQQVALASLPPKFTEVLENLLSRLETGSVFSEESCSFSQARLLDELEVWLNKASARLAAN